MPVSDEGEAESGEEEDDQGWAAWMWSMVPQILPEGEEGEGYPASCLEDKLPIMSLGFYIQHASLVFKVSFARIYTQDCVVNFRSNSKSKCKKKKKKKQIINC